MREPVFTTVEDKIRAVVQDVETYPYLNDLWGPMGEIIQGAPAPVPALTADFLRRFHSIYRNPVGGQTQISAYTSALDRMQPGSNESFRYLCAAQVFIDQEGKGVDDEIMDILGTDGDDARSNERTLKPPR